jgi:metal-dependent HD superfamily phosphatase/phosphodiesterase
MRITLPARGNRTLRDLIERVNRDTELKALWHAANVNAVTRLQINDHSWVHIQIVTNIGLKLLRELRRAGVEPGMVADYGMTKEDAEVVVVLGCLTHCLGMAIHRTGHEDMSLFLAADRMPRLLEGLYEEPELTIVQAEVLQTIISHRSDGVPLSVEAGVVRVADALDMAKGRSRIPFESGRVSIHSLSAAAIEEVRIKGTDGRVKIEIEMNNSAGLYQVDNLLRSKLRGSGLEERIEVEATISGESEKRLLPPFRL